MRAFYLLIVSLMVIPAHSMVVQTKILRARAYSKKLDNGIYASLDLKQKSIKFTKSDLKICRTKIIREKRTLKYSCDLYIPTASSTTILNKVKSPESIAVKHGNMIKTVKVNVSKDGRMINFATEFDNSAIDFDFAEFNSEVFNVFNEAAQQIIASALTSQKLKITTLEN